MAIHVEFYGIARRRAGTAGLSILPEQSDASLAEVWRALSRALPEWGAACVQDGRLRPEFVTNVDGKRFVADPATRLQAGQTVMILAADAGG
jgi:molybdopterin converting factor small subunit